MSMDKVLRKQERSFLCNRQAYSVKKQRIQIKKKPACRNKKTREKEG